MNFEFTTANRIIFGQGVSEQIPNLAKDLGDSTFITCGSNIDRITPLIEKIRGTGIKVTMAPVTGEPTIETIQDAVRQAEENKCNLVIGVGGGSVIDTGKAIAALLTNHGDLEDYLEVIGQGKQIKNKPAPYIAVPTTSGTGAEVTRNSVIGSLKHRVKVSMRSPLMLPTFAVIDPFLTLSVPKDITSITGLDALTQLIESYVSNKANPLTDGICREGIKRAARSLKRAYEHGDDVEAREDMSIASLFGGLALANSKLGAVHGFAGPMGGMFKAPHGALCAKLLPPVIEANVRALKQRKPNSSSLRRFDEVGQLLTGSTEARAEDAIAWIKSICNTFNLKPLLHFGVTESDIPDIVKKAGNASSMKGNPIELTADELGDIVKKALF